MAKPKNDFASIGDLYGGMLNGMKQKLVSEGKLGPSVKPGEIGEAPLIKGGPQTTAGYMPAKVDKKTMSKKDIDDNLYDINSLSYDEDEETIEGEGGGLGGGEAAERDLGPWLLAAAFALFLVELIAALGLRGLWRPRRFALPALLLLALVPWQVNAQGADGSAALATRLAYIRSGDAAVDETSRSGLAGLSDFVNRRTAAALAEPHGVTPGQDDLSFYPLLYWAILPDAPAPSAAMVAALNDFMRQGGIILMDTRDQGSGEGMSPGARAALRRVTRDLAIPPLIPVPEDHVLNRAFYLLNELPGRFAGGQVWVARDQDRANDSVSPVILGGHDWAAAWAMDRNGQHPHATIPGGARQRVLAYRFGTNLVMYALTGNYKGDQVHVPAILERLGN